MQFYSNSYASKRISEAMAQMDIKLLFIPILFVFIKIWGTIRFCLSVLPNCQSWIPLNGTTDRMEGFCIKDHCAFVYSPFLIMMQVNHQTLITQMRCALMEQSTLLFYGYRDCELNSSGP